MASDAVAAGTCALRTVATVPTRWMRKSSTSVPSASTACARTPAGAPARRLGPARARTTRPARERAPRQRAVQLTDAGPPVPPRQPTETPASVPAGTAARTRHGAVPLPGEREHRVGSDVHRAVDGRRQMDAEERVPRVGHRIDEPPHPVPGCGRSCRYSPRNGTIRATLRLRRGGYQVGVQARAHDQPGQREGPAGRVDVHPAIAHPPHSGDGGPEVQLAAASDHIVTERARDGWIVDYGRGWGEQRGDARHVRLELAQLRSAQPPDVRHAVSERAPFEFPQLDRLGLVPRDHQLAALVIGQPALGAVRAEQADAAAAQRRLGRARGIVDSGVHDPGVVAGLVGGYRLLLLEDDHGGTPASASCLATARPTIPAPTMPTGVTGLRTLST